LRFDPAFRAAKDGCFVLGNPHYLGGSSFEGIVVLEVGARALLEPRIDGLALEGQDAKDALVDATEGFLADEAVEGFDAEGELAEGQRALR
jgi:hypothetical protein